MQDCTIRGQNCTFERELFKTEKNKNNQAITSPRPPLAPPLVNNPRTKWSFQYDKTLFKPRISLHQLTNFSSLSLCLSKFLLL